MIVGTIFFQRTCVTIGLEVIIVILGIRIALAVLVVKVGVGFYRRMDPGGGGVKRIQRRRANHGRDATRRPLPPAPTYLHLFNPQFQQSKMLALWKLAVIFESTSNNLAGRADDFHRASPSEEADELATPYIYSPKPQITLLLPSCEASHDIRLVCFPLQERERLCLIGVIALGQRHSASYIFNSIPTIPPSAF